MEYKVHYNGHETNNFNVLASWFQELKNENERLKEANEQHRDDYTRLKLGYDEFKQRNRDLEEENKNLKDALEFCQREASFAREHAHNVEVNAERIRKELD